MPISLILMVFAFVLLCLAAGGWPREGRPHLGWAGMGRDGLLGACRVARVGWVALMPPITVMTATHVSSLAMAVREAKAGKQARLNAMDYSKPLQPPPPLVDLKAAARAAALRGLAKRPRDL